MSQAYRSRISGRVCSLQVPYRMPAADNVVACDACGNFLGVRRSSASLHVTAALSLAALVLYVPANIYPILRMTMYGSTSESTIWDGVVSLMRHDQWVVAVIVFMASLVIPLIKLTGLFFLVGSSMVRLGRRLRWRTNLYRFIDRVGPWAMLDVFLLAVLVSLVKLGELATVVPGPGLFAFTGVVVFTMLASAAFDPKLIWEPR
jgi:paraquat-inducible protein A